MSKGFKKLLLFGAAIGAAAGAFYYFNQKKIEKGLDDFDDFEEDDEDDMIENLDEKEERSYVPLHPVKVSEETGVGASDAVSETADSVVSATTETIEEFFDEEDEEA